MIDQLRASVDIQLRSIVPVAARTDVVFLLNSVGMRTISGTDRAELSYAETVTIGMELILAAFPLFNGDIDRGVFFPNQGNCLFECLALGESYLAPPGRMVRDAKLADPYADQVSGDAHTTATGMMAHLCCMTQ
jgi:hypothetical protein